jgi:hypothetical protein
MMMLSANIHTRSSKNRLIVVGKKNKRLELNKFTDCIKLKHIKAKRGRFLIKLFFIYIECGIGSSANDKFNLNLDERAF